MARSLTAAAFSRSDRTILLAAIILAAIAAVLVFVAANSGGDDSSPKTVTPVAGGVEVVTAVKDIPANTTISADMVQVTSLPAPAVLAQAYTATDKLIGLSTRYPLLAGEQVTPNKVGDSVQDDKSLAAVVRPGMRAVAIPVSEESMVGGLLLPGDFVDVVALFDTGDAGIQKAVTIVQNVEVLAVGQEAQDPIPRAAGGTDTTGGTSGQVPDNVDTQPNASTLTLSVTPDQAQIIALAAKDADLWTTLRSRGDNANVALGESNFGPYQAAEEAAPAQ
jgi:pilus assembly protein CpaB